MIKVDLVISTYNWLQALEQVLLSTFDQSIKPNEIIVADDGSGPETKYLIERFQETVPIPLKHVWHEDSGFRRTVILNKAIKDAVGEYIIQVDGDCILSRQFIKDHLSMARQGLFLYGSRVEISQELFLKRIQKNEKFHIDFFDSDVKNRRRIIYWPGYSRKWAWIEKLFSFRQSDSFPHTISGCNMSFWKKDFLEVNGYNEDIIGWGFEDIELAIRLLNKGVKGRRLKFQAGLYHIDHKTNFKNETAALIEKNRQIFQQTLKNKSARCQNGLSK